MLSGQNNGKKKPTENNQSTSIFSEFDYLVALVFHVDDGFWGQATDKPHTVWQDANVSAPEALQGTDVLHLTTCDQWRCHRWTPDQTDGVSQQEEVDWILSAHNSGLMTDVMEWIFFCHNGGL